LKPLLQWIGLWTKKITGKPHDLPWENLWFPVGFPLNQSIDYWVEKGDSPFLSFLCLMTSTGSHPLSAASLASNCEPHPVIEFRIRTKKRVREL